jgi:AcrR family transcriptional regulator
VAVAVTVTRVPQELHTFANVCDCGHHDAVTEFRRTQADRSNETRGRLVAAAVASLVDRGWSQTTAVEVCARAGVTRGALLHHFPNLLSLIAAALESVHADFVTSIPRAPRNLVELVDTTWTRMCRPEFKAVVEAWLATANDPEVRHEIGPVVGRFSSLVGPDAISAVVADAAVVGDEANTFSLTARSAMLGLALERALSGNRPPAHETAVVERLRSEAAALDERATRWRRP